MFSQPYQGTTAPRPGYFACTTGTLTAAAVNAYLESRGNTMAMRPVRSHRCSAVWPYF